MGVRDVPGEVSADGFESKIVKRYERTSRQRLDLLRKLYVEGLSTGDLVPVFRELVGETAALSRNAIVRLKQRWESDCQAWCSRTLSTGTLTSGLTGCVWERERTGRRLRCYAWWERGRRS